MVADSYTMYIYISKESILDEWMRFEDIPID